jgi:hypothetical protein
MVIQYSSKIARQSSFRRTATDQSTEIRGLLSSFGTAYDGYELGVRTKGTLVFGAGLASLNLPRFRFYFPFLDDSD